MAILITGGTGFIGSALCNRLLEDPSQQLIILSRKARPPRPNVRFITSLDSIDDKTNISAIINLAGEEIAAKLWTTKRKKLLWQSRIDTTQALVNLCGRLSVKPSLFLSASAVGYYGLQPGQVLTEESPATDCFSHQLCQAWEEASLTAKITYHIPTYILRFGVVLGKNGGVYSKFHALFRLFLYPKYSQKLYFPWVSRADVIGVIRYLLQNTPEMSSPIVNLVAPETVDYTTFFEKCRAYYGLKIPLFVPVGLTKRLLGALGSEIVFGDFRVIPKGLNQLKYVFIHPTVERFLEDMAKDQEFYP